MKNCLVLGAGGFIGKNLCAALAEKYNVRAVDIAGMKSIEKIKNVEVCYMDFIDATSYDRLLEDIDTVFYLICTTLPKDETEQIPNEITMNLIPLTRLMDAMTKKGVNNMVFFSSAGTVYGENTGGVNTEESINRPICSYGVLKDVSERYIEFYNRKYGMKYKIIRLTNPYGLGQDKKKAQGIIPIFIEALINDKPISIWGDGNNIRDYIYMDDAIEAAIKVGEYEGGETVFNVGSGENFSITDIVEIIQTELGKQFNTINYQKARQCDVQENIIDISKAQRELDWNPKIDMQLGLKKINEYYRGEE